MLPPLTERLVDCLLMGWRDLDEMPSHRPDQPDWTRLDCVIAVVVESWAHQHGGTT